MTRFFRASVETLEFVRSQLDAAWGYPNEGTKTFTALPPASDCLSDPNGRVYVAVDAAYCEYVLPTQLLSEMLASGAVEEVDEATYMALQESPV